MKGYNFKIPMNYFYKKFFKIKNIDDYKVNDINNFKTKSKFDLVTTIGTLCYLDVEKYFEIIKKITSKGALVYIHSDHFFFPINSSKFLGNFPYCNQRLSMKDLQKIY